MRWKSVETLIQCHTKIWLLQLSVWYSSSAVPAHKWFVCDVFFPWARRSHDKVGDYIAASAKFGGHGTAECDKEDLYVKPLLAWEKSRHLATLPLVSLPNDVWETSAEIPYYRDLGSASDWLNPISHSARPIRSTTQIRLVTRHQYEILELVSQTSFGGKTSGSVVKFRLFSQAKPHSDGDFLLSVTGNGGGGASGRLLAL